MCYIQCDVSLSGAAADDKKLCRRHLAQVHTWHLAHSLCVPHMAIIHVDHFTSSGSGGCLWVARICRTSDVFLLL
jgi:hypothetical protein